MKLKSISINNFKALKAITIPCNECFNFIIGENNIGKSTIFEAIQLWNFGFNQLIQQNEKLFYGKRNIRYLSLENLYFLRHIEAKDLFNDASNAAYISFEIYAEEESYNLKIKFEKPATIDAYIKISHNSDDFIRFSNKVGSLNLLLKNAIFIYQTIPLFNIVKEEPFYNNALLLKKINLGESQDVLRNKILNGDTYNKRFTQLQISLSKVLNKDVIIKFKNKNTHDDEYIRINIEIDKSKETDISLMGSGILQIVDIFATLEYINKKEHSLNILLIDEPDSHIHSNLQATLIDELRVTTSNQYFIITHNDRLINKAEENELLFVNKESLEKGALSFIEKGCYNSIVAKLSSSLFSIDDVKRNKILVITEGKTDKLILENAWTKLYGDECPFVFMSSGLEIDENQREGCSDQVRRTIEFLSSVYQEIRLIGLFDNDREGYCKFKGLHNKIFQDHSFDSNIRKHKTKDVYGMVLPYPEDRASFVTAMDPNQRYFEIEHYFRDEILETHKLKGGSILGTNVFEIRGDKTTFASNVNNLPQKEFENFKLLFDQLQGLFN